MMEELTIRIQENREGGTVHLSDEGPLPTTGYFVGGVVSALIIEPSEFDTEEADQMVQSFLIYLKSQNLAPYVGWWTDEETGKLYVDATTWYRHYDVAESACRSRNEIAFYDIARGRSFRPVIREEA